MHILANRAPTKVGWVSDYMASEREGMDMHIGVRLHSMSTKLQLAATKVHTHLFYGSGLTLVWTLCM